MRHIKLVYQTAIHHSHMDYIIINSVEKDVKHKTKHVCELGKTKEQINSDAKLSTVLINLCTDISIFLRMPFPRTLVHLSVEGERNVDWRVRDCNEIWYRIDGAGKLCVNDVVV